MSTAEFVVTISLITAMFNLVTALTKYFEGDIAAFKKKSEHQFF